MFERHHLQTLIKRMHEPRRFLQVIMGPRQVGKTTLVTQLIVQAKIDYLFGSSDSVAASNATWLEQQWEAARIKRAQHESKEFLLVMDEIQKIDNWSETVKLLWDTDTRNKFKSKGYPVGVIQVITATRTYRIAGRQI